MVIVTILYSPIYIAQYGIIVPRILILLAEEFFVRITNFCIQNYNINVDAVRYREEKIK